MELMTGTPLVEGDASGSALVTSEPLSLWGGLDPKSGEVIDRRHELSGQKITGRVLVLPYSRGSTTASTVLLEAIRAGTAPAAIVASCADPMLALGAVVAGELYNRVVPVVALNETDFQRLRTGDRVAIQSDGTVELTAEATTA
ncbi:MAG TPA: DUF126 domain-containing protein [Chloroflexota bacterium]|nr:DUF126 domain-containing protein [Chloroflexota bacterium]